jgi:periplasmic protein TonB
MKYILVLLLLTGSCYAQDTLKEPIQTKVEIMPEPPGGLAAFYKYIAANIQVPVSVRTLGIEGKVYMKFVIDSDGSITNVSVMKGVLGCPDCDEEAKRLIESYPQKWKPGTLNGEPVRVYYNLAVGFKKSEH